MSVLQGNHISNDEFESMLLNADKMNMYLKQLKESYNNFHTKIDQNVLESLSKSSEYAKQVEEGFTRISQLSNQRKELKKNLDSINLEQKIIEKKTISTIKEIEKTKAEITASKEKKEAIALDIIDLQAESEKRIDHIKKQWGALKKAWAIYKSVLDIHIDLKTIDDVEQVTVTFFGCENITDKKFFVILTNQDNCWKVKKIEPELSAENKYQLNDIVQFSEESEVANVTLLLCELRKLFIKNHFPV